MNKIYYLSHTITHYSSNKLIYYSCHTITHYASNDAIYYSINTITHYTSNNFINYAYHTITYPAPTRFLTLYFFIGSECVTSLSKIYSPKQQYTPMENLKKTQFIRDFYIHFLCAYIKAFK